MEEKTLDSTNLSVRDELLKNVHFGRRRIILDYEKVTKENFKDIFSRAFSIFDMNKRDCRRLLDIYLGKQDILFRPEPNTSNINNKVVVNLAFPTTREIVGYTYSNPFEYIPTEEKYKDDTQKITDTCTNAGLYGVDMDTATYASICGFGYEITIPSTEVSSTNTPDVPLIVTALSPEHTFIVQSTDIGNPVIMAVMEIVDENGNPIKYICWTDEYKITYKLGEDDSVKFEENPIGINPITFVPNSLLLTGDWELAISLMDALNQLVSDTVNDVEGAIKSLLVLLGVELSDADATLAKIKDKRLLTLSSGLEGASAVDAKFISPQLNDTEVSEIRAFLTNIFNVVVGIPDRQGNMSGGDTGTAVINRNGWTDIEIVAKLKESLFKVAKKQQLGVIISILKNLDILKTDIKPIDITVSLGRNTLDNLSTKSSAFSTLVGTGKLHPLDCLEFSGLTNRTAEVVARGEEYERENEEKMAQLVTNNGKQFSDFDENKKNATISNDNANNTTVNAAS